MLSVICFEYRDFRGNIPRALAAWSCLRLSGEQFICWLSHRVEYLFQGIFFPRQAVYCLSVSRLILWKVPSATPSQRLSSLLREWRKLKPVCCERLAYHCTGAEVGRAPSAAGKSGAGML
jgi:hypothetical protein